MVWKTYPQSIKAVVISFSKHTAQSWGRISDGADLVNLARAKGPLFLFRRIFRFRTNSHARVRFQGKFPSGSTEFNLPPSSVYDGSELEGVGSGLTQVGTLELLGCLACDFRNFLHMLGLLESGVKLT